MFYKYYYYFYYCHLVCLMIYGLLIWIQQSFPHQPEVMMRYLLYQSRRVPYWKIIWNRQVFLKLPKKSFRRRERKTFEIHNLSSMKFYTQKNRVYYTDINVFKYKTNSMDNYIYQQLSQCESFMSVQFREILFFLFF